MDLIIRLDPSARRALHRQIEDAVRDGIRSGRLPAATQLPSSRALARQLEVSRGVVVEAYAQLAAEGYLTARPGSATRVAVTGRAADPPHEPMPASEAPYSFHPGLPDLSAFPRAAWARAQRRVLRDSADASFGYGDVRGAPDLRRALAGYLGRSRGAMAEPERILVSSGFVQGLSLVCRALRARGVRRVALEDPGWLGTQAVVAAAGLEPVPVPVDQHGLVVERLHGRDVGAVVVTPAHESPTGVVLAPHRRAALLEWAEGEGAVVIEDDYDAEYRYGREPVGALQGLAPDRVAYAGSASKILAPGLRLAWLVLPTWLAAPVAAEKATDDLGTPVLEQLTLADFIARGELDRHLRRMRPRYRRRRDALAAALRRHLPEVRLEGVAAGLYVLAVLPPGTDEAAVTVEARELGVEVHGAAAGRSAPGPPALVLGYANLSEPAIERGIELLASVVRHGRGERARASTAERFRSPGSERAPRAGA